MALDVKKPKLFNKKSHLQPTDDFFGIEYAFAMTKPANNVTKLDDKIP